VAISFIFTRTDIVLWDGGPPKAFRPREFHPHCMADIHVC
jgi:hypothetical protein